MGRTGRAEDRLVERFEFFSLVLGALVVGLREVEMTLGVGNAVCEGGRGTEREEKGVGKGQKTGIRKG